MTFTAASDDVRATMTVGAIDVPAVRLGKRHGGLDAKGDRRRWDRKAVGTVADTDRRIGGRVTAISNVASHLTEPHSDCGHDDGHNEHDAHRYAAEDQDAVHDALGLPGRRVAIRLSARIENTRTVETPNALPVCFIE